MENKRIGSRQIFFGLGWTTLSTFVTGITQILRLSILARLLPKEDFGIIAILTTVLGLTQVFSDLGFSAAIMGDKNLTKDKFINLFWLQFIIFNLFMILMSLASPLVAKYYNIDSLEILLPLILSELFFISIGKLYDTVLQKNLLFKVISLRNIISAILSLVLAVILALTNFGVYSLVLSTIFHAALVNIWNFVAGQKQFRLTFRKINYKEVSDQIRIGLFQMGTQVIDYMSSKLDIFVISTFLGMDNLGIYNLAKELVLKFVLIVNTIVNKVMLPVLAASQQDLDSLKRVFYGFLKRLSLLNTPIVGLIFLFSPIIVKLFYGETFLSSTSIVSVMSVWSLFVVLTQPNALLAITLQRTDISFIYTIIRLIIMSSLLFLFARDTLMGAALTMLGVYMVMFIVNWYMLLRRMLKLKLVEYLHIFESTWISVSLLIFIIYLFNQFVFIPNEYLNTLVCFLIYVLGYLMYLFLFEKNIFVPICSKLLTVIKKK